jgi:tetratricopeptide (TPR) repeat protein
MNDLGLIIDESVDARIFKAVRDLKPEEFRELAVRLLENMGLKVTAAALSDDIVFVEGDGKEGKYLVMISRHQDHASIAGLKSIKEKAATEARFPALVVTHELEKEAVDFAGSSGIAFADGPKFLVLMKRYDLARPMLREVDKRILEKEGDRFLPSIGKLDDMMESADGDIEHGNYREALEKLGRALELKPTHYVALQKKTHALMELGDYGEAFETCRKATELMPNDSSSWYLLGLILHELGDLEGEIGSYDMALKISPRMAAAMLNKGATMFQLGKLEEALKVYEGMLRFTPTARER